MPPRMPVSGGSSNGDLGFASGWPASSGSRSTRWATARLRCLRDTEGVPISREPSGLDPEPGSRYVRCFGWPLIFLAIPGLWAVKPRVLVLGATESALYSADRIRQQVHEEIWSGPTADLRWRKVLWLVRGETPPGDHFYVDLPADRRAVVERVSL